MANPYELTAPPPRSPEDGRHRLLAADTFPPLTPPSLDLQVPVDSPDLPWSPDDDMRRDMARLDAGFPALSPSYVPLASAYTPASEDAASLRAENEEMHKLIEEMKQIFQQATAQEETNTKALEEQRLKTADLERRLLERDDEVALLTGQIHELERVIQESPAAPPPPPSEDELAKLADELEKERCSLAQDRKSLEQDRQQLRDDEESLMKQMRDMEVQMAKERAEMARQRTDLQRLHAEVRQELEQLQRGDGHLRDRLAQFQRRHQAVFDRGNGAAEPAAAAAAPPPSTNGKGSDHGVIRRFFGR
jgi:septal ring factor EnvC (AmiA/AmiB activator)